ncbi:hypothetical protein V3W47_05425 [Deinococcus sp. YIM 134068]|uniref:hypothetical protein n=1 Tax=Deinococcus lichenicola TaxID=3118910 RepID=UPI002F93481F
MFLCRTPALTVTVLLGLTTAPAWAAAPSTAWNADQLSRARYLILDPRIEGNPKLLSGEQWTGIVSAMRRDSAGAIKRRYPRAIIVTGEAAPETIRVTPVLVAPNALVPWAKLNARLDFDLPDGGRVSLNETFGLLTLWQQQAQAANYVYNELAKRLP